MQVLKSLCASFCFLFFLDSLLGLGSLSSTVFFSVSFFPPRVSFSCLFFFYLFIYSYSFGPDLHVLVIANYLSIEGFLKGYFRRHLTHLIFCFLEMQLRRREMKQQLSIIRTPFNQLPLPNYSRHQCLCNWYSAPL